MIQPTKKGYGYKGHSPALIELITLKNLLYCLVTHESNIQKSLAIQHNFCGFQIVFGKIYPILNFCIHTGSLF